MFLRVTLAMRSAHFLEGGELTIASKTLFCPSAI
jgi:hypothetical protein